MILGGALLSVVLLAQPVTITDGDTIRLGADRIRVHGIDAPEADQLCQDRRGQCYRCGKSATAYLRGMIGQTAPVCVFTGQRSYKRQVSDCTVNGQDIGEAMIRAGWAVPYDRYMTSRQWRIYPAAFSEARAAGRGIHAGRFIEPKAWRKGERLACNR